MKYTFLICSERSGSNLLTKIMDSHPDFCGPTPPHLIRPIAYNHQKYGDLQQEKNWKIFLQDVCAILNNQLGIWKTNVVVEELSVLNHIPGAVLHYIFEKEAAAHGKQQLFIKENDTYTFIDFIEATFPQPRFVYLVRDPRDVAASWKNSPNHPGGVMKAVEVWGKQQTANVELYEKNEGRCHLVKYEELLKYPVQTLTALCRFVGIDYDAQMLRFFENDLTGKNARRLNNWENLAKPLLLENIGKYKNKLVPAEVRYIEAHCKAWMDYFAYKQDYKGLIEGDLFAVKSLEDQAKGLQDLSEEERMIREKRLEVIRTIVNRNLP